MKADRRTHIRFTYGTNVTQAAVRAQRRSRHAIRPAHPRIADALCAVGAFIADTVEPVLRPWRQVIRFAAWTLVVATSLLVIYLRVEGLLP